MQIEPNPILVGSKALWVALTCFWYSFSGPTVVKKCFDFEANLKSFNTDSAWVELKIQNEGPYSLKINPNELVSENASFSWSHKKHIGESAEWVSITEDNSSPVVARSSRVSKAEVPSKLILNRGDSFGRLVKVPKFLLIGNDSTKPAMPCAVMDSTFEVYVGVGLNIQTDGSPKPEFCILGATLSFDQCRTSFVPRNNP